MGVPGTRNRMFHVASDGRIICKRKNAPWSAAHDQCIGCKRTDRPHMSHGRCNCCYQKWRREHIPGEREKINQKRKQERLGWSDERLAEFEAKKRLSPTFTERRKRISNRWNFKQGLTLFPPGARIAYDSGFGAILLGVVTAKTGKTHLAIQSLIGGEPFQIERSKVIAVGFLGVLKVRDEARWNMEETARDVLAAALLDDSRKETQ